MKIAQPLSASDIIVRTIMRRTKEFRVMFELLKVEICSLLISLFLILNEKPPHPFAWNNRLQLQTKPGWIERQSQDSVVKADNDQPADESVAQ